MSNHDASGTPHLRAEDDQTVDAAPPAAGGGGPPRGGLDLPFGGRLGRYVIVEKLGAGGFGSVYKAEQRAPIRRTVAVKVINPGFDTREVIARFESERQALARMDHPNIARVVDAASTDAGRPYFVMEYVPGRPITEFADENRLSIRHRLELFQQVCRAVTHAHTKAVIHRDIKPSNVLAFLHDGTPVAKVIDFGIAKALTSDRLTDATFNTARGTVVGTYETMSPEQAAGSPDIDTRTDVYSLGVLLYELLTGSKPLDRATLAAKTEDEIRRVIREVDPPRPSARLAALGPAHVATTAGRRRVPPDSLVRELRGELEWIPLKAMRKDRAERYDSVAALEADVQNFLDGRPLVAGPDSAAYVVRKFARRHRGPLLATAAAAAVLVAGVATYVRGINQAQEDTTAALGQAKAERVKAQAAQQAAEAARKTAEGAQAAAVAAKQTAEREADRARHAAALSDARYLIQERDLPAAWARAADAHRLGGDWEDGLLYHQIDAAARQDWALAATVRLDGPVTAACLVRAGGGDCLVVAQADRVRALDPRTGRELAAVTVGDRVDRLVAAPPPAAAVLALSAGGTTIRRLAVPSLAVAAERRLPSGQAVLSVNAREAVVAHRSGEVRVVGLSDLADRDVLDWAAVPLPPDYRTDRQPVRQGTISPSGRRVVLHGGAWWHPVLVWDRGSPAADAAAATRPAATRWVSHPSLRASELALLDDETLFAWQAASGQGGAMDELFLYRLDRPNLDTRMRFVPSNDTKGRGRVGRPTQAWAAGGRVYAGMLGALGCATTDLAAGTPATGTRYANLWPHGQAPPAPLCADFERRLLVLAGDANALLLFVGNRAEGDGDLASGGGSKQTSDFCAAACERGMVHIGWQVPGGQPLTLTPFDPADPPRQYLLQWLGGSRWQPWAVAATADGGTVVVVAQQADQGLTIGATFGELRAVVYHPGGWDRAPPAAAWPIDHHFRLDAPPTDSSWQDHLCALTPGGGELLYWTSGGRAVRHAVADGRVLGTTDLGRLACGSLDGRLVAGTDPAAAQVLVVDVATGREVGRVPDAGGTRGLCLTNDGRRVVLARGSAVEGYEVATGARAFAVPCGLIPRAWPAGDGRRFVGYQPDPSGNGGSTVLADVADGRPVALLDQGTQAGGVAYLSPGGRAAMVRLHRWAATVVRNPTPAEAAAALARPAQPPTAVTSLPRVEVVAEPSAAARPARRPPAVQASTPPRPATAPAVAAAAQPGNSAPSTRPAALDATDLATLRRHLGEPVVTEGEVEKVTWTAAHNAVSLEFAGPYETRLMVWVGPGVLGRFAEAFGPEFPDNVVRRRVRVSGTLNRYGGRYPRWQERLQLTLTAPGELELLPPADPPPGPR